MSDIDVAKPSFIDEVETLNSRWVQGDIDEYSFFKLAQFILPETEFPVRTYPYADKILAPEMEQAREIAVPRFHYVTKKEETAIFDGTWRPDVNYESKDMPYGFYFIDVPIGCLKYFFKSWFCDPQVDALVKPYYLEEDGTIFFAKQDLITAVFIILHEYGHYCDYKRIGSKVDFAKWVYESKKPFREYDDAILERNKEHTLTEEFYRKRWDVYRNCQDEHSADKYALNNLKQKVDDAFHMICG